MDGSLKRGAELLLEGSEILDESDRINWAEFVRHRGHAFRFSLLFEEAITQYLRALSVVSDVPSLNAKLIGNLAECQCWTDPELAIKNATLALQLNERLRNLIEIGKNHATLSLAFSALGSHEAAETHYELGTNSASGVGYAAGLVFSGVSGCVSATEDPPIFQERLRKLQSQIENLGTYHHQLLIPALLDGNEDLAARIIDHCAWIEPDTIIHRARSVILHVKSAQPGR